MWQISYPPANGSSLGSYLAQIVIFFFIQYFRLICSSNLVNTFCDLFHHLFMSPDCPVSHIKLKYLNGKCGTLSMSSSEKPNLSCMYVTSFFSTCLQSLDCPSLSSMWSWKTLFNINSRNNSTSKYKQFLTLNVRFISLELQGKRSSSLTEGFLGAI